MGSSGAARSGGLTKIAEVSGTGASGVLEFSSIPATYRKLIVDVVGRGDAVATATAVRLTFETSPTAGAYDYQQLSAAAATASAAEALGTNDFIHVVFVPAASSTANLYGTARIELPEYVNTSFWKPVLIDSASLTNLASGGLITYQVGGVWESTAAIDRIRLTLSAGNWTTASRATLYGVA